MDVKIAKIFELDALKPKERIETPTKIAYIPVLPFISDSDEQLGGNDKS